MKLLIYDFDFYCLRIFFYDHVRFYNNNNYFFLKPRENVIMLTEFGFFFFIDDVYSCTLFKITL